VPVILSKKPGGGGSGGGVTSISESGQPALTGAVTLSEGTGVTLTQVGQDIEIAGTGGAAVIDEEILAGTAASIQFASIPGTYRHLRLVIFARGDTALGATPCRMRFNGDSGGNYDVERFSGSGGTIAAGESTGDTSMNLSDISAASAPSNVFALLDCFIPYYAVAGTRKMVNVTGGFKTADSSGGHQVRGATGWYRTAGAITQIDIFPNAGNFAAGTSVVLYGVA
jgi:hypothetical protein